MSTSNNTVRFKDTTETAMIPPSSQAYNKRRSPNNFTKKFELGDLDTEMKFSAKPSHMSAELKREDKALKEELLRIFNREKETMEQHYLNKVQELLQSFKNKKLEWEEVVRLEREDLEMQFENEKCDMHQNFTQEIAKMTRTFQEERGDLERSLNDKVKEKEDELEKEKLNFEKEKLEIAEKNRLQIADVRKECQKEFEEQLASEKRNLSEKHASEFDILKSELERTVNQTRYDLEKKYVNDLSEVEMSYQKSTNDMKRKFDDEKKDVEKTLDKQIESLEETLRKEKCYRADIEQNVANEKISLQAINNMLKEEVSRLKEEIAFMRKESPPVQEVKIVEKLVEQPAMSFTCRGDLPSSLKEDFDHILNEFKSDLKAQFEHDRELTRDKIEEEKERFKEKLMKEKEEEVNHKLQERERLGWEYSRNRDEMEKEIERQFRAKQLTDSLNAHQQRFDEVTKRLEEEERLRLAKKEDYEVMKAKSTNQINELARENDGLKTKIRALEENNSVLKTLKEEGQKEVDRLRKAVEELKVIVETKLGSDRGSGGNQDTTRNEITPLIMSMLSSKQAKDDESADSYNQHKVESLNAQRRELEQLRNELRKHEQDIRDRRTMEDAAKLAADQSQEKFESLLSEKKKLEDSLRCLESRVVSMQEEFTMIRYMNAQKFGDLGAKETPHTVHSHPPPPQPVYAQPPIIMQTPCYPPTSHHQQATTPQHAHAHHRDIPDSMMSGTTSMSTQPPRGMGAYPGYLIPHDVGMPGEHEKIYKLKLSKDRLTKQVDELQSELKEAGRENVALQKQCREYERQLESLNIALERERDLTSGLRDMMKEEKMKGNRLNDQLERENQTVLKIRTEMEEMRLKMQREIHDLQVKLTHASQTLAAVRQQASSEISTSGLSGYSCQHETKSGKLSFAGSAMYGSNSGKGMLPTKIGDLQSIPETRGHSIMLSQKEEITRLKELEDEKVKLQMQLEEAKAALNTYAAKLESQPHSNKELSINHTENLYKDFSTNEYTTHLCKAMTSQSDPREDSAQSLRHQKVHLQKLIERLTYMNPPKS